MQNEVKVKQVVNKSVKIRSYEVVEKKPVASIPKWKLKIANLFGIPVPKRYQFAVRVNYYGGNRLISSDVVTDQNGNIYTVMKELNRVALLLSYTVMDSKPVLAGKLQIQGRKTK